VKLLFYGLSLGPPWVEGLRNTVRSLSRRLVERGFDVTVLSRGFGVTQFEGVRYVGLNVGGESYSENASAILAAVARWILSHSKGFDVVHGHSSFPLIAVPGLAARAPCVFTLYSPVGAAGGLLTDSPLAQRVILRFSKGGIPVFAASPKVRFVAISEGVRRSLPRGLAARSPVIPVGVEFGRFNRRVDLGYLRDELGSSRDRFVLFAGDVTPWKGGEDFLVAASAVLREAGKTGFLFLTKGTYEYEEIRLRRLKDLAERLGLGGSLIFLGRRKDIEAVYQLSDVVVLPYRSMFSFMSTPLSLLEAMSAGRPVVASRVGDMPSIVEDGVNGLLFDAGNTGQLASKILYLLNNPDRASRLGEAAMRSAREYDWSNIVERYVKLYSSL